MPVHEQMSPDSELAFNIVILVAAGVASPARRLRPSGLTRLVPLPLQSNPQTNRLIDLDPVEPARENIEPKST